MKLWKFEILTLSNSQIFDESISHIIMNISIWLATIGAATYGYFRCKRQK